MREVLAGLLLVLKKFMQLSNTLSTDDKYRLWPLSLISFVYYCVLLSSLNELTLRFGDNNRDYEGKNPEPVLKREIYLAGTIKSCIGTTIGGFRGDNCLVNLIPGFNYNIFCLFDNEVDGLWILILFFFEQLWLPVYSQSHSIDYKKLGVLY